MKKLFDKINSLFIALTLITVFLLSVQYVSAQVKVGENPATISSGSVLEIESSSKGLLFPRVRLTSTTVWGLDGGPVAGMQVFNNNIGITAGLSSYPIAPGGIGMYYWDGAGWVSNKTLLTGGASDFDWLKSGSNSNPSDPADIANGIFHGGNGNQEVVVRTNETAPDKFAKLSVRMGDESDMPIVGNLISGTYTNGDGFVGLQAESAHPIVFRTTGGFERMRINPHGGSVGIGTPSPAVGVTLTVAGPFVQSHFPVESDAPESVRIENGGIHAFGAPGSVASGYVNFKDNREDEFDARISYAGHVGINGAFILDVTSTGKGFGPGLKRALTILNENGHVGINELSPFYQLSVGGDINASGEVRNSGNVITSDVLRWLQKAAHIFAHT